MVAVNTARWNTLDGWVAFWKSKQAADVIWANDDDLSLVREFNVQTLGTTTIIDRNGQIVYRDGGATPYDKLKAEVGDVL